jgi:hypothetical protein
VGEVEVPAPGNREQTQLSLSGEFQPLTLLGLQALERSAGIHDPVQDLLGAVVSSTGRARNGSCLCDSIGFSVSAPARLPGLPSSLDRIGQKLELVQRVLMRMRSAAGPGE